MEDAKVVTEEVEIVAESATAEVKEVPTEEITEEQLAEKEAEAAAVPEVKKDEVVPPVKKKPTLVDQIVKTRARAQDAELKNARLEGELEAYKRLGVKPPEQAKPDTTLEEEYRRTHPEPDMAAFDDMATYTRAIVKHEKELDKFVETKSKERVADTAQQSTIRQDREVIGQNIEAQKLRGVEKYEDFDELVINNDDFKMSVVMNDVLAFAENGEDGAIFLAKNPKELERIRSIKNPVQQGIEMLRLVDGIKAGTIQVVKKSAAPPPPSLVSGRVAATDKGPPEDIQKLKEWLGDPVE